MDAESQSSVLVGVVMGSRNDYAVMRGAVEVLKEFGIAHEVRVVSAHRTPDLLFDYADSAIERGLRVIIAGAGGAAHHRRAAVQDAVRHCRIVQAGSRAVGRRVIQGERLGGRVGERQARRYS